ncbi:MAG: type III pantothenate kinase [Bernardetiaceae bacterium]|jgi:type III pantothenate kinase|nr:type III pantothenate kinase [Bernardetiaceae bacterium]
MVLAIDIGNSDVVVGLWHHQHWLHQWRTPALITETAAFYDTKVNQWLAQAGIHWEHLRHVTMSSVVPPLTEVFRYLVQTATTRPLVRLGPEVYPQLGINLLNPQEIGSDLVANALAAHHKFRQACIVVDFGTALTFTAISARGDILGVNIAPGLATAIKALSQNTARLPTVPLEYPSSALGRGTTHAIQAGVLIGYRGLVEALLAAMRAELQDRCIAVATGGLASVIPPLRSQFYAIEPTLTLDGLRLAAEKVLTSRLDTEG